MTSDILNNFILEKFGKRLRAEDFPRHLPPHVHATTEIGRLLRPRVTDEGLDLTTPLREAVRIHPDAASKGGKMKEDKQ